MDIKNIFIIIGAILLFLGGYYIYAIFFSGEQSILDDDDDDSPIELPIEKLKGRIDQIANRPEWDFSSKIAVKQELSELNNIVIQIESYAEGGLITDHDASDMKQHFENKKAEYFDKGIHQFFQKTPYNQTKAFKTIYDAYSKMSQRKKKRSAYPLAMNYFFVRNILFIKTDSLDLVDMEEYIDRIENTKRFSEVAQSAAFKELEKKCLNSIAQKAIKPIHNKAQRVFSEEYYKITFDNLTANMNAIERSSIGNMPIVTSFMDDMKKKVEYFPVCPELTRQRDTTNICRFCNSFKFYNTICN